MNQPQNDNATVSREQAIKLARESAFAHSHQHSYLPQTREEADRWQPHEWVLLALQAGSLPTAPAATHDIEALISIRNQLHQMSAAKDLGEGWADVVAELMGDVQTLIAAGASAHRVLTCVYCGHEYPQDTPAAGHQVLTDHISICPRHPMRHAEQRIAVLRAALEGIVGVSEPTALIALEAEVRALDAPADEVSAMLGGIQALLSIDTAQPGALGAATEGGSTDGLDAARYRWLRDEAISFPYDVEIASPWCVFGMNTAGAVITPIDGTKLDAAIDAARRFAEDNEPQANSTEVGP